MNQEKKKGPEVLSADKTRSPGGVGQKKEKTGDNPRFHESEEEAFPVKRMKCQKIGRTEQLR